MKYFRFSTHYPFSTIPRMANSYYRRKSPFFLYENYQKHRRINVNNVFMKTHILSLSNVIHEVYIIHFLGVFLYKYNTIKMNIYSKLCKMLYKYSVFENAYFEYYSHIFCINSNKLWINSNKYGWKSCDFIQKVA